jgi:hypothetical protein
MKRLMLLALLALSILAGGLPIKALAAASTGAHVIDLAHSHEEPDGSIWYFTIKGVSTETITREGNAIYTGTAKTTSVLYDAQGNLVMTGEGQSHQFRLIKDPSSGEFDNFHVWSDRFNSTITYADGTVCTFTFRLQYANGLFQILDAEQVCT